MKLVDKTTGERVSNQRERELMAMPAFLKFARLNLPGATYHEIFNVPEQDHATIQPFPPALPALVSDNPIIYRNNGTESFHTDEFIFPITPTQVLFRHKRKTLNYQYRELRVLIDMLLIMQATKTVACSDLRYPPLLIETFQKVYKNLQELRHDIFVRLNTLQ